MANPTPISGTTTATITTRPTSTRPPSISSRSAATRTASAANTVVNTQHQPALQNTAADPAEPPPAPSRPTSRNLAASHLARRPPAYSTARTTAAETAARRGMQRPEQRTTSSVHMSAPRLDIPSNALSARNRSRSRGRNGELTHVREEEDESADSDNDILVGEGPAGGLDGLYALQADLLGREDNEIDWEDEDEEGGKVDTRIIDLWKERRQGLDGAGTWSWFLKCSGLGYEDVDLDLESALDASMREKVEGLREDRWMYEAEDEDPMG